jgi:hypothetical protein
VPSSSSKDERGFNLYVRAGSIVILRDGLPRISSDVEEDYEIQNNSDEDANMQQTEEQFQKDLVSQPTRNRSVSTSKDDRADEVKSKSNSRKTGTWRTLLFEWTPNFRIAIGEDKGKKVELDRPIDQSVDVPESRGRKRGHKEITPDLVVPITDGDVQNKQAEPSRKVKARRLRQRSQEPPKDDVNKRLSPINEEPVDQRSLVTSTGQEAISSGHDVSMSDNIKAQIPEERGFADGDFVDDNDFEIQRITLEIELLKAKERAKQQAQSRAGPSRFRGSMNP